ncbi:hypothetical protein Q7P35_011571 [Cladosporium inversicolor]
MSYLRPTCSDAAARVTNLGLSRYVPSIWQGDAQVETVANITPNLAEKADEATERFPSQRPLDRRWDKSRGLVFGDRKHVLRNRTWTPARGIVFASNIGQHRGYATRRITPAASVAPKSTNSQPPAAGIYGSTGLPNMERPAKPTGPAAPKGAKQQELERNLKAREKDVKNQAEEIEKLKAQLKDAQVELIEERQTLKNEKERIYSKGMGDGQLKAKADFEDDQKRFELRHQDMKEKLKKAEARYPELKRNLEEDIVRREGLLLEQYKLLELAREKHRAWVARKRQLIEGEYSVANQFAAEVKLKAKEEKDELDERERELRIKENDVRTRKAQRSDYHSYRSIWRNVHAGRKDLDEKFRWIWILLAREHSKLTENLKNQGSDSIDQLQLTAEKLKELEAGVNAYRKDLIDVDKELRTIGHDSRTETRATRFDDIRLAANSMSTALRIASINPLRSIKARTQQEIDDIESEIQNASNATTREELRCQKEALNAEKVTVNAAMELAHLDRKIQTFETLQREPYVHKAVYMTTFDLRTQVDRVNADSFNGERQDLKSPEVWNRIRDSLTTADATAKQTALILEMKGEHKEHEKKLDAMIVEKIAFYNYQLQAKRAQLFGHHKSARAAAKRAPPRTVRAWGATSSSSTSGDPFDTVVSSLTRSQSEMAELRRLLNDATVSLDPESRDRNVRRYNELNLKSAEYEIRALSKKLISNPRKRSESEQNQKFMTRLEQLRNRRDVVQHNLLNGIGPRPKLESSPVFPQRTPNVVEHPAAVAESSGLSPDPGQDDATIDQETFNQQDAELKLRMLRAELSAAEAAGESQKRKDKEEQVLALVARIHHAVVQTIARKKAALGEVTPENAKQHGRLDAEIGRRSAPPQTRRQRLFYGRNRAHSSNGHIETDGKRLARLMSEVVQLKQLNRDLSDHEVAEMRSKKLEIMQMSLSNTIRSLESLGPKTADNAHRHERFSKEITLQQDTIRSFSMRKTESADAAGTSESKSLDDLMAAWSFDNSPVDDVSPTTNPTVVSEASKLSTQDFTGLNMTPTSAKQATHQPTGRRNLHDYLLWSDFLRQQESREGKSLSSLTTASVNENGTEIGSGDVSVVPSADCATADATSNTSTEAARDDADAAKSDLQAPASLSTKTSSNDTTDTENTMAESDEDFVPTYEISSNDKKNALIASRNSTASFWRYSLYKNAAGNMPTRHYCTTFEQTEAQIAKFLGEKVVGFDLEWEKFKSRPGEDSAKRCVSLMQIAAEGKVALFHLAMFKGGDSTEELIPPSLRAFLEDPNIIKTGVNIGGDATRLRNCFGIEMQGNIELSHLYKLVTYGETNPEKVNRGLYALANQVKEVLHLPLAKGAVRTSSWSKRLNDQQTEYAVSDAYAGLRLYYELERRRKAMVSKPPRPAFHELAMPILLGGGELPPTKGRRSKQPVDVPEEVVEESAALQEQDDSDDSEDREDIYDTAEDLEAFDAYVESQDAHTMPGASLPEITYPTLPSLDDLLSGESDSNDDSSLPSDPITKTFTSHRAPTLHTPEAIAADSWATAWQDQLPATTTVRVSQPHLRAYHLWHHQGFDLKEIPALLRKEPLALSTVVSYIAEVLQKQDLEFDVEKVRELRARLPASVRGRYAKLYANE